MNDREKYEFELLENRIYKLERLLLASNIDFEDTFVKKVDTVNVLSDITSAGADIEDAVDKAGSHHIEIRLLAAATDHTVATTVGGEFRVPEAMTISDVGAYVDTAGVTGTATFDINEAGTSILSTKITIDTTEKSSKTAATLPVISDSAIAADAILTFDIDVIQTTPAAGLVIWMKIVV